ncbi:CaiB/BaiF CoA transferase family protein [Sedimentitalea sp. XS_ASV28]|uniref:CaiB/BaiF CoA transferase family protein n=1 Tax=Sedimentitalea sp. XS_ASV28 TaxID=3241296 RepID=UPI0035131807
MSQPLEGIRILDATHVLAGPFCGYQLSLLGADVIRVENPNGGDIVRINDKDPARREMKMGLGFLTQNANKRSVALNLKSPEGQEAFKRIAMTCDVVVENFRPGKMKALGLGAADLQTLKPDLIYCSITGFGQSGPLVDRPAYDHIVQGMSGIMSVTGTEESGPVRAGFPLVDYLAGQMAAFAISAALVQRERTGKGEVIDCAMLDAALSILGPSVTEWSIARRRPGRPGNKPYSGSPFSGCYDTRDGVIVVVGNTMAQAERLAHACGLQHLLDDPRVGDWQSHPELADLMGSQFAAVFATRTALEWECILNEVSVPCGKVREVPEILDEPHVKARHALQSVYVPALEQEISVPGLGCTVGGENGRVRSAPPELSEQANAILGEAGYSQEEIATLKRDGITL